MIPAGASKKATKAITRAVSGSPQIMHIWKKFVCDDTTYDVLRYADTSDEARFQRCTWRFSNIMKTLCPASIYLRLDLNSPPGTNQLSYAPMPRQNRILTSVTARRVAELIQQSKPCDSRVVPMAIFFSVKYEDVDESGDASRKGHANILFFEGDRILRYDPMGVSRHSQVIDSTMAEIARAASMQYASLVGPDVPPNLVVASALQRRSRKYKTPGERGTCAIWVLLVAMLKVEQPHRSIHEIVDDLSRLDDRTLYALITAMTAHFVNKCAI